MMDVIIVGGGPVGTLLACELRLAGVEVAVLERRAQAMEHSRALGVHARTLEILDLRGIVERFLRYARKRPAIHFGLLETLLDLTTLDSGHPYTVILEQTRTEAGLRERLEELGTSIQYGCTVVAVEEYPEHVEVICEGDNGTTTLQARFVVGCDGGSSVVRNQAGIAFPGSDGTMTAILADAYVTETPPFNYSFNAEACIIAAPLPDNLYRFAIIDPQLVHIHKRVPLTLEEVQGSLKRSLGTDFGIHSPQWLSRTDDTARQAETYHKGRVFVAGDAAHIHAPTGGQGLNVGLQDAMNLGWKLAAYLQGRADEHIIESYHAERHPIGEALMQNTQVQSILMSSFSAPGRELRAWMSDLLKLENVNRLLADQVSAIGTVYAPPANNLPEHRLIGHRLPNLSLTTNAGRSEILYQSFHEGNFVLLDLTFTELPVAMSEMLRQRRDIKFMQASLAVPYAPLHDVQIMLIRPDGHIAWASDEKDNEQRLAQVSEGLAWWCNVALPAG